MSNDDQLTFNRRIVTGRYNSFLTGTAFLVAAYVVVVTAGGFRWLPHAINWVGLYLAIFFTLANYHAARLMLNKDTLQTSTLLRSFLLEDILSFIYSPTSGYQCFKLMPNKILPKFVRDSTELRTGYIHTWLVPILFVVFWTYTWFFVLDDWQIPSLGIGLLFIYFVILLILKPLLGKIMPKVFKGNSSGQDAGRT